MSIQSVVIDNGTSFTKIGYGGNSDPNCIIPTVIADFEKKGILTPSKKNDIYDIYNNHYIGERALSKAKESKNHKLIYPMKNGLIENWDLMEKYWSNCIYEYLKCDPGEYYFLLTEKLMNTPENRQNMAEIFFETFNVQGLYIGIHPILALLGCNHISEDESEYIYSEIQKKAIKSLTGIVIDSGESDFNIVPICEGNILGAYIRHFPISGKKINEFMIEMINQRGEKINIEDLKYASIELKEKYGYVAKDLVEELAKYDKKINIGGKLTQNSKFKKFEGIGKISNKPYSINTGYELFFTPELIFTPGIIEKNYRFSLDEMIDYIIQMCPIQYRKKLYSNIIFSGKSTSFKNLDRRLELSIQKRVDERIKNYLPQEEKSNIKVSVNNSLASKNIVWLGGSSFSSNYDFKDMVHTREEYQEKGPVCCRNTLSNFIK